MRTKFGYLFILFAISHFFGWRSRPASTAPQQFSRLIAN
jgi:hypothetical protein